MGTTTPNIGLYIPADGETNYGTAFANGMLNLDTHDHSGPPNKGVPLSSSGFAAGSVTRDKLNSIVLSPGGGLSFDVNNAIQTDGLLKAIYGLGANGLVTRTSGSTAAARTLISSDPTVLLINDGNGVAGNPTFSLPTTFYDGGTFTPTINTSNNNITGVSYALQDGNWQKIGKWIMIDLEVVFNATGGTGNLVIQGLPLAAVGTYWFAGYSNSGSQTPNQQVSSFQTAGTSVLIFPVAATFSQLPCPVGAFGWNFQMTGIYQWTF